MFFSTGVQMNSMSTRYTYMTDHVFVVIEHYKKEEIIIKIYFYKLSVKNKELTNVAYFKEYITTDIKPIRCVLKEAIVAMRYAHI